VENLKKNRDLSRSTLLKHYWLFFDRIEQSHAGRGFQRVVNMLSTEAPTEIVGKYFNTASASTDASMTNEQRLLRSATSK
jgi:hypothetical protein